MKLEVLVSCMGQPDDSILDRSGITTDAVIINQCSQESAVGLPRKNRSARLINTRQRGLSKSRNMAIENARGDICLLCDDDERFAADYDQKIITAFEQLPDADIIAFKIANQPCRLKSRIQRLSYLDLLKIKSWQIAFRRDSIIKANVRFDPKLGAGSGNGAQEENKFLFDCRRAGLRIYYVPEEIASVFHTSSTWFHGFTEEFFFQRGTTTRYILGFFLSSLYACYYLAAKYPVYGRSISFLRAAKALFSGIYTNKLQEDNQ